MNTFTLIGLLIVAFFLGALLVRTFYRHLLRKYMSHVLQIEGSTFLEWSNGPERFTDMELDELRKASPAPRDRQRLPR